MESSFISDSKRFDIVNIIPKHHPFFNKNIKKMYTLVIDSLGIRIEYKFNTIENAIDSAKRSTDRWGLDEIYILDPQGFKIRIEK